MSHQTACSNKILKNNPPEYQQQSKEYVPSGGPHRKLYSPRMGYYTMM